MATTAARDTADRRKPEPWVWPQAAYVHVPFCAHRCGYCDFATVAGADHLADRYLDALERELATLNEPQPVATIFIGGGTPTRLAAAQLERLLALARRWLLIEPDGEWTVEANPGTLDVDKADVLAAGGVNRVSLGAQSFRPEALRVLERDHRAEAVAAALELVRPRFPRWSLDLIFGVPGTRLDTWAADLEQALAFEPAHLSCYGLTYEKGTPLWKQRQRGAVEPVGDETERAMLALTIERLAAAGLRQYEISNYARPGHEARHNLVYWANDAYFGFGLGAARYVAGVRSSNTRDLAAYLRRVESGQSPTGPRERLEPADRARETAMLMLRRTQLGIDRADFTRRTGHDLDTLLGSSLAHYRRLGYLHDDGSAVRLTTTGLFWADSIAAAFLQNN